MGCARSKDEVEPPSTNGGGPTSGQVWALLWDLSTKLVIPWYQFIVAIRMSTDSSKLLSSV